MPRKPRVMVTRKVTAVLSESTVTKVVRSHGVPVERARLVSTYRLECGHTTTRDWPRNRPSTPVGGKLSCKACSEAMTDREAACA